MTHTNAYLNKSNKQITINQQTNNNQLTTNKNIRMKE